MNVKKSSNFIKHTLRYSDKPYDFYCLQMLWDNDSHNLELNGYNYQNKIEKIKQINQKNIHSTELKQTYKTINYYKTIKEERIK